MSEKDIKPHKPSSERPINEDRGTFEKSYTTSHLEDKLSGGTSGGGNGGDKKDKGSA